MYGKRALGVIAGLAVLALITFGIGGCKNSTSPIQATSKVFPSTTVNSHDHTITMLVDDVTNRPINGFSTTTSVVMEHSHSFALTQGQLVSVDNGASITATTGPSDVTGTHTHDFTIVKWY